MYLVCAERDEFEFDLARVALRRPALPMLCICRGMQVLNIVCGGTLHSHLPERFGSDVDHRLPPRLPTRHPVHIESDSRLAQMLGATEVEVCSWHHQAVDRMGSKLRITAYAADGVV